MTPLANRFQLLRDGTAHPAVFRWNGAIPGRSCAAWLAGHRLALPYDFIVFLQSTGGGELFGSETLFGPFSRAAAGDDVLTANEGFRERGLSPDYVVFHRGVCASAIRLSDVGSSRSRRRPTRRRPPSGLSTAGTSRPSATASARGTASPPSPRRSFREARPGSCFGSRRPSGGAELSSRGIAALLISALVFSACSSAREAEKRAFLAAGLTLQREADEPSFNGLRTELDLFLNDELQDLKDRTKRQEDARARPLPQGLRDRLGGRDARDHVRDAEQPGQPGRPVRARRSEHGRGAHRLRDVPRRGRAR